MRKYIVISDISKYNSYANLTARLMYLHIACNVDTSTYTYVRSIRQLARDLDVTIAAARHALEQLVSDGLITTHVATHLATHYATHSTAQQTTHLHLVTIKDLEEPSNAPSNTPNNTPNTTPNDTPNDTQSKEINIINKQDEKKFTLSRAREEFANNACGRAVMEYCGTDEGRTLFLMRCWIRRMTIKKRDEWDSKEDAWQHLLDWCNKHKNDKNL